MRREQSARRIVAARRSTLAVERKMAHPRMTINDVAWSLLFIVMFMPL
jgi:hypothetical protein